MNRIITEKDLEGFSDKELKAEIEAHEIILPYNTSKDKMILHMKVLLSKGLQPKTKPFYEFAQNIRPVTFPIRYVKIDFTIINFMSDQELIEEMKNQGITDITADDRYELIVEFMKKMKQLVTKEKLKPYKSSFKKIMDALTCYEYANLEITVPNSLYTIFKDLDIDDLDNLKYNTLKDELKNQGIHVEDQSNDTYLKYLLITHIKNGKNKNPEFTSGFKKFLKGIQMKKREIAKIRYISHVFNNPDIFIPEMPMKIELNNLTDTDFEDEKEYLYGERKKYIHDKKGLITTWKTR